MKKLLTLLMVLVMSVCMLSSCKKNSADDEKDRETVRETVLSYTELMVEGSDSALNYVREDYEYFYDAEKKVSAYDEVYRIFENANAVPEDCMNEVEKIRREATKKFMQLFECEVKDIEIKGDKATAKVVLTTPRIEKKDSFRLSADETSKKAFKEEEIDTILKGQKTGKIPSELFVKADKLWLEAFVELFEKSVHKEKITYQLEKIEDMWLIVGEKS